MLGLIKKIFGTAQSRKLKGYQRAVKQINEWEEQYQTFSDAQIQKKVPELRARLKEGATLDELLPEAYALVKNTCRRLLGTDIHVSGYDQWDMVPYDVQLLGAIALHQGTIAEMQTGEGKTLTAAMPLFLNALTGKPVHLVTVNDYLATRDCAWMGGIFRFLGMNVQALTNRASSQERKEIYLADIVYGTASEFGFDYLRDNSMAHTPEEQCQRGYFFVIIDEVDSILIDEARTPLIISGPAAVSKQMYGELQGPVAQIVRLQRDCCNQLATKARKTLDSFGRLKEDQSLEKLSEEEKKIEKEAFCDLWLVMRGTPQSKILKRIKEHPDLRAQIEKWETYFYAEASKEQRYERLAELYIIVDERANEFELTDKGIQAWVGAKQEAQNDFVMLDLGGEYAQVDRDTSLSDQEKMEKKIALREEDSARKERAHNLRQLFRAYLLMERDVDYIVQNKKIVIIDENTGRPQPGRRFADGLHQAIEAKEGVPIQGETQTYAVVTLQNYFRGYVKISGMTGTAISEANEFKGIYKTDVLQIPTHKKCQRKDSDDQIYMTEREKYNAILKDIIEIHGQKRPILIGTESVEVSEKLSRILKQNKLEHTVLNAKNHAKEAEIIAQAGKKGRITVATNMAGRGTDIRLEEGVADLGGLHVISTTRQHRRKDRQLQGRCARQGDPGSFTCFVSFEDSLMRLFASPKLTAFLQRFRPPEGESIAAKVLNRSIETAQKRIEQRNYSMRKHTLEYDDVMNRQRKEVYAFRNEILHQTNSVILAEEVLENICSQKSTQFFTSHAEEGGWDALGYCKWLMEHFPVSFEEGTFEDDHLTVEAVEMEATKEVLAAFEYKLAHEGNTIAAIQKEAGREEEPLPLLQEIIRSLLLRNIDTLWQDHLLSIDHLRAEVNLRVIGQKDPLIEFKHEAFERFERFSQTLRLEIGHALFRFEMMPPKISHSPLQAFQKGKGKDKNKDKNKGKGKGKDKGKDKDRIPSHSQQEPRGGLYLSQAPIKTE